MGIRNEKKDASAISAPSAGTRFGARWDVDRFSRSAEYLAAELIGHLLVRRLDNDAILAGRIVETEAYIGVRDRASHAFGGRRTPRNEAMYGPPGTAYVYFTYGMHFCFNVVCGRVDEPFAVLVRALEPEAGIDRMSVLRSAASRARSPAFAERDLCRGPARLCQALAIGRELNGLDLTRDPRLWVAEPGSRAATQSENRVVRTARIGVGYAGAWANRRLRWAVAGHPCLSVPVAAGPRPRRARKAIMKES